MGDPADDIRFALFDIRYALRMMGRRDWRESVRHALGFLARLRPGVTAPQASIRAVALRTD